MELQKASVRLSYIRLMQQPILRKTCLVRIGPVSPRRKSSCKNLEEPAFHFELLFTNEPQLRESEELFFPSHIF